MESEAKVYKAAPMEPSIIAVTIGTFCFMFFFIYMGLYSERLSLYVAGLFALLIIISALYKPLGYEIGSDRLKVYRSWPFPTIIIPISTITDAGELELIDRTTYTFSICGLFSLSGWIWNRNIGRLYTAVTDTRRMMLITANKKYAISPEDPARFIEDLRAHAGLSV